MARKLRCRHHKRALLDLRNRTQQRHWIAEGIEAPGIDQAQHIVFDSFLISRTGLRIETLRDDVQFCGSAMPLLEKPCSRGRCQNHCSGLLAQLALKTQGARVPTPRGVGSKNRIPQLRDQCHPGFAGKSHRCHYPSRRLMRSDDQIRHARTRDKRARAPQRALHPKRSRIREQQQIGHSPDGMDALPLPVQPLVCTNRSTRLRAGDLLCPPLLQPDDETVDATRIDPVYCNTIKQFEW